MNPGDTVRWVDQDKRSHFGRLVKLGRTRARVDGASMPAHLPIEDITPWPPRNPGATDTTPPQRRAKRGRAA